MLLSDLQKKDIVNMYNGKNLGRIVDVEINEDGKIINFVVMKKKLFWKIFSSNNDYYVPISDIDKIGEDVILVKENTQ